MQIENYDELIEDWNNTLGILAELTQVPVALVMKVDNEIIRVHCKNNNTENPYHIDDHEVLKDSGLYCEYVISNQEQLHVANALTDPNWCNNPDIKLNMIAYLGVPLLDATDSPFGTLCILDKKERHFSSITSKLLDAIKKSFEAQIKLLHYRHQQDEQANYKELLAISAAIAHEVNTPIGVALAASDHMQSELSRLDAQFCENKLTKNLFNSAISTLQEANQLLTRNLNSAIERIANFKRVAADEFSDELVPCNLANVINDCLQLYKFKLKQRNVLYEVDTLQYQDVELLSIPHLIRQSLTILMQNSLMHGFDETADPKITLKLITGESDIQIHYFDNGVGIEAEKQKDVFLPFFTTKRTTGCTGLGLSIMKKIVTQKLEGSVSFEPSEQGMHLLISLPKSGL